MSETRHPKGGTRDPRTGTQIIGRTQDPRPETFKVEAEIQDTCFTWDLRPKTQDTERRI